MRILPVQFATNLPLSSTFVAPSSAIPLDRMLGFSVQAVWTGTAVGTLTIQASVNGTDFSDITSSLVTVTAAGSFLWNFPQAYFRYVQLKWTPTGASTGSLSAWLVAKGNS